MSKAKKGTGSMSNGKAKKLEKEILNRVEKMLKAKGPLPNKCKNIASDMLFFAVEKGYTDIVEELLKLNEIGQDIFALKNDKYCTALEVAACLNKIEVVKVLLHRGAKIVKADNNSPLKPFGSVTIYAIDREFVDTAKLLIEYSTENDLETKDSNGKNVIGLIVIKQKFDLLDILVKKGYDLNKIEDRSTVIHSLAMEPEHRHNAMLEKFLSLECDPNFYDREGKQPIHYAAMHGNVEALRMLAEKTEGGINSKNKFNGLTPLHYICISNKLSLENIQVFVDLEADFNAVDKKGNAPLQALVYFAGKNIIVEALKYVDPANISNLSKALFEAVIRMNKDAVEALIEYSNKNLNEDSQKVFLESVNEYGETVFNTSLRTHQLSIKKGSLQFDLYMKSGFKVYKKDKHNIYLSSKAGNEISCILIKAGADVNTGDEDGLSPLHKALLDNNTEMFEFLLSKEARTDVTDQEGYNLLHYAAFYGRTEMLNLLIKTGINFDLDNPDGISPINLAASNGHLEIIELLRHKVKYDAYMLLRLARKGGHEKIIKYLKNENLVPEEDNLFSAYHDKKAVDEESYPSSEDDNIANPASFNEISHAKPEIMAEDPSSGIARKIHEFYQRLKTINKNKNMVHTWNTGKKTYDSSELYNPESEGDADSKKVHEIIDRFGNSVYIKIGDNIKCDKEFLRKFNAAIEKGFTADGVGIKPVKVGGVLKLYEIKIAEDWRLFTSRQYKNAEEILFMEFDMEGNHAKVKQMAEISKQLQIKLCIEEVTDNYYVEPHAEHQEPSFASTNKYDRDDYKEGMPAPELDFGAYDYQ